VATIEELRSRLKLGGKPSDPRVPRVRLHKTGPLSPPATSTGLSKLVPASAWGMLGNDSVGDCVAAGALHAQQLIDAAGKGVATNFTTQDAITMYSAISGYVPGQPNTDQGAQLIDGLNYWVNHGLGAGLFKADAFAQFNIHDQSFLKQVIADFGVAYLALEVPQSAMQQFDAGQPWTVVARSPIEGGHCVPAVDYDANYLYVVTWAAIQPVAWAFVTKYFDEGYAVTSADLVKATGGIATGIDTVTANADWQALTGQNVAPFPVPAPNPPTPTPTPTPAPTDAIALLTEISGDLGQASVAMRTGASETDALKAKIDAFVAAQNPPHVHGH
jgi:hypothetical protein